MKEILFLNPGGESPCSLQLVFNTGQEAINFLAYMIDDFGTENYSAKFITKNDETLVLKLLSEKNKMQAITSPNLKYNSNDFFIFTQAPINKTLFVIMCGIINDNKFNAIKYKDCFYITVSGFETI